VGSILACYGTLAILGLLSLMGVSIALQEGAWASVISAFAVLAAIGIMLHYRRCRAIGPVILAVGGRGAGSLGHVRRLQSPRRNSEVRRAHFGNAVELVLHVDFVERGPQSLGELPDVVVGPEMHEEEPRLVGQHVVVQGGHLDPVLAQRPQSKTQMPRRRRVALRRTIDKEGLNARFSARN
jgi:hypothetical protein